MHNCYINPKTTKYTQSNIHVLGYRTRKPRQYVTLLPSCTPTCKNVMEGRLYISGVKSRGLNEGQSLLFCKCLGLFCGNWPQVTQVRFVTCNQMQVVVVWWQGVPTIPIRKSNTEDLSTNWFTITFQNYFPSPWHLHIF